MQRIRFYLSQDKTDGDYRPVVWPIKYPYWCTGETGDGQRQSLALDYGEQGVFYTLQAFHDRLSILFTYHCKLKALLWNQFPVPDYSLQVKLSLFPAHGIEWSVTKYLRIGIEPENQLQILTVEGPKYQSLRFRSNHCFTRISRKVSILSAIHSIQASRLLGILRGLSGHM